MSGFLGWSSMTTIGSLPLQPARAITKRKRKRLSGCAMANSHTGSHQTSNRTRGKFPPYRVASRIGSVITIRLAIVRKLQIDPEILPLQQRDRLLEFIFALAHNPHLLSLNLRLDLEFGIAH